MCGFCGRRNCSPVRTGTKKNLDITYQCTKNVRKAVRAIVTATVLYNVSESAGLVDNLCCLRRDDVGNLSMPEVTN